MSVWTSDSQRLDLYRDVYLLGPKMFNQILDKPPKSYMKCSPLMVSDDFGEDWEEVAVECKWPVVEEDVVLPEEHEGRFDKVQKWHLGIAAIYHVMKMVMDGHFTFKPSHNRQVVSATVDAFIRMVAPSTQITPRRFLERSAHKFVMDDKLANSFEDASESFKFLRVLGKMQKQEPETIDTERFIGPGEQPITGFAYKKMYVFRGMGIYENLGFVFSKIHMDYFIGASMRLSNTINYLARTRNMASYNHAIKWLKLTINCCGRANTVNAFKAAKAFHKVRTIYQMTLLSGDFQDVIEKETSDYYKDGLHSIVSLTEAMALLQEEAPVRAMETVHIYKWMPPPDFDATSIPAKVHGFHMTHRDSGLVSTATPRMKMLYARIQEERKANLLYAYKRKHGRWPANINVRGATFSKADLDGWDHTGCMVYNQLGKDIVSQIKDKTIVSASKQKEMYGRPDLDEKSYLLWYMSKGNTVDTIRDIGSFSRGGIAEDNYVRVAYKPEAQKPDSRLFYMAPPLQRTLLGEFEGNLANVARYYPGSLMGKDTADKNRLCARVMDLHAVVEGMPHNVIFTNYIITFDLAKFSPRSCPKVTEEYHKFWAKTYGLPEIEGLYKVGCTAKIVHTTCGLNFEYQNKGVDLEGFRGKMQTMFHADLLSTSARIGREERVISGKSDLVVFIDDGAIKVAVTGIGEEAKRNVARFLAIMQEVYEAAGQENHPSKTVVSREGGEILAQFYYRGLKVPQGIKALMRLMPDYENAAATMAEEVDQLYATSQGAIKDGADWIAAYTMMVEAVVKNIHRWLRRKAVLLTPEITALKLMTPKSFGGLGVSSLQGLVTNSSTNATIEGSAMLNRLCRAIPAYRNDVYRILGKGVVVREPLSILRDPLRVRLNTPVIIENRLTMEVVKWLESNSGEYTHFMAAYKDQSLLDHATAVAEALLSSGVINAPLMERAWKCTPLAFVESVIGKFKRSATIINLLGMQKMSGMRKKNMGDVCGIFDIPK
jgi:hypothetical protein